MRIVHLTASTFFGGPERQMLGLAEHLPASFQTSFLSFSEGGRCEAFLNTIRRAGFEAAMIAHDTPYVRATIRDVTSRLIAMKADILLTHSYKPNVLGRIAARLAGIPIVAVSRGWTWENFKVRMYERCDRLNLRYVDRVVAVSDGQAEKIRKAGVKPDRVTVIRNSARVHAFTEKNPEGQHELQAMFADSPVSRLVISAGRLSPEKGFDVLVRAARKVLEVEPSFGFVHFGEGNELTMIAALVREFGIAKRFILAGFRPNIDKYLPWADLVVLPSHTEGLPNVALEASAAGVAVVATRVGGTPEVISDGETGLLVPPGQPDAMADAILRLLQEDSTRTQYGEAGRKRMNERFTFAAQTSEYLRLFEQFAIANRRAG